MRIRRAIAILLRLSRVSRLLYTLPAVPRFGQDHLIAYNAATFVFRYTDCLVNTWGGEVGTGYCLVK